MDWTKTRTGVAFWVIGLCNNLGYVVMLSAAHDIMSHRFHTLEDHKPDPTKDPTQRDCNELSTGAVLLADIVPSVFVKGIAPFCPLVIHVRVFLITGLAIASYIVVAEAPDIPIALLGVVFTSLSQGLGEATFLGFLGLYQGKVGVGSWSSGTGGAGFFGSFTYAFLVWLTGSPRLTLYILVLVPVTLGIMFWTLLPQPSSSQDANTDEPSPFTKLDKARHLPSLYIYMVPLFSVYVFQYYINQGLAELMQFDLDWISHATQYRVYQVLYQTGVFISRSSLALIEIRYICLLASLQGVNAFIATIQAVWAPIPTIWLVFALILYEGLIAGATYVNCYNRISKEVPEEKRVFSMGVTSFADATGITLAGFIAIPVHNYICRLPKPEYL